MEESTQIKTVSAVVIVLIILAVGGLLFWKNRNASTPASTPTDTTTSGVGTVEVKNTEKINGVLPPPAGFPSDIPLEAGVIVESATTNYSNQDARQLSASYTTTKTVSQVYSTYNDYMKKNGYGIKEGGSGTALKSIFGTKQDANLSVVVSNSNGKTLVQISYLIK